MKRIILLLSVGLLFAKSYAQAEPANYAVAIAKFRNFYNANHPDSIFSLFSPEMKNTLPLATFKPTTEQLKTQYGDLVKTEFVKYDGKLAVYKASFKGNTFLLNLALNSRNMLTGLFLGPYQEDAKVVVRQEAAMPADAGDAAKPVATTTKPEKPAASTITDPGVVETPILVKTLAGQVAGTLAMPANVKDKVPLVIIAGDSGPTDRDGNNEKAGINGNTYKLLAEGLAKNGIASVRYDKRMVGESTTKEKESQLRIDDYSDDLVSIMLSLNDDPRFSRIVLFGHGEGALVCMMAAQGQPVKGYISAEGAGDPADKILTEQMKKKPQYQADEFKAVMDSLRKGKTTDNVDPAIYYIARPSIQNFLSSWCRIIPVRGIKSLKMPILIIQGTTDLTVPVDQGEKLKKAKSEASLVIVKGMNHILKDAPADEEQNMATYDKPDLPLSPTLVPAIVEFVNKRTQ